MEMRMVDRFFAKTTGDKNITTSSVVTYMTVDL